MAALLVVSGPSGIGKSYLVRQLGSYGYLPVLQTTTRRRRDGEIEGVDYEFLTLNAYLDVVSGTDDFFMDNEFFGHRYGIRRSAIEGIWEAGRTPVLVIYIGVIDQIARAYPDSRRVFLIPENGELLRNRLRSRTSDTEEVEYRLSKAREELEMLENPRYRSFYHDILRVSGDDNTGLIDRLQMIVHQELPS